MTSASPDPPASAAWFHEPMRWLQLNLVRDDVLHADIAAWQRYCRDAKADGLTLSAAGATRRADPHDVVVAGEEPEPERAAGRG